MKECDVCGKWERELQHVRYNGQEIAVCSGECFLVHCERDYQRQVIGQRENHVVKFEAKKK